MKKLIILGVLFIALILAAGCDGQEKKCLADGGYYVASSTGDCYHGKMCTCDNGAWGACRESETCTVTPSQALPDLKIWEVWFENDQLFATVRNDGPEPAQYIGVGCYMVCTGNINERHFYQFSNSIPKLEGNSQTTVSTGFTLRCEDLGYRSYVPNMIRLQCEVDHFDIVKESDDRNNFFYVDIQP